jgi:hypothetical protein
MGLKKVITFILAIFVILNTSSCLSYNTLKQSNQEINQRNARNAIVAQKLGDDGVGIGVNLLDLEALGLHPWKQLLSACGDALMVWGASEATKYVQKELNNDNEDNAESKGGIPESSSSGDNNITINGDNNSVVINGEKQ